MKYLRQLLRAFIAVLILGLGTTILVSSWNSNKPILGFLSYQSVASSIAKPNPPPTKEGEEAKKAPAPKAGTADRNAPFWLHLIYLTGFLAVEIGAYHLVYGGLKKVFPDSRPKD